MIQRAQEAIGTLCSSVSRKAVLGRIPPSWQPLRTFRAHPRCRRRHAALVRTPSCQVNVRHVRSRRPCPPWFLLGFTPMCASCISWQAFREFASDLQRHRSMPFALRDTPVLPIGRCRELNVGRTLPLPCVFYRTAANSLIPPRFRSHRTDIPPAVPHQMASQHSAHRHILRHRQV
jgi:hypothetical protein